MQMIPPDSTNTTAPAHRGKAEPVAAAAPGTPPLASSPLASTRATRRAPATASAAEIEFKLTVPESRAAALGAALDRLGPVKTSLLHAHYFDTPDDRLARAGISLRLRQQDGRWHQTVKSSGGADDDAVGALRRAEHEVAVEPSSDGRSSPTIDLARHHGSAAGAAIERLLADAAAAGGDAQPAALVKRYGTRIVRRSVRLARDGSDIELSLDQGHIEAGIHSVPICELELEMKSGAVAALTKLARRWQRRHGLWLQAETKADRGRRLTCGESRPAVVRAQPTTLPARLSADRFARRAVAGCLAHILPNAAAVADGSVDADHVHQLRVGLRRLRTALRELDGLSDAMPTRIEPRLAHAFAQLGAHRDRDIVLESIRPKLLAAGAMSVDWTAARGAPVDLQAIARDTAFQCALIDAAAFALAPAEGMPRKSGALRRRLRNPLRRLHRQIADGGRHFKGLSEDEQHAVRKRLKRLRYLAEFAAPLFAQRKVDRYLGGLRPAQDALGEYNDALVASALARDAASRPAPDDDGAGFAVRWLADARDTSAGEARKSLRKVDKAPRFWR